MEKKKDVEEDVEVEEVEEDKETAAAIETE
jgi:hypothetical protein